MVGVGRHGPAERKARHLLKCGAAKLGRLGRDNRGTVVVLAGIIFPVLVGGMGLGAEAGYWYWIQRKVQHAADVAAYAAAVRMSQDDTKQEYEEAALNVAEEAGYTGGDPGMTVNSPPQTPSAFAGEPDHVQVILTESVARLLSSMFVDGDLGLTGQAVARIVVQGNPGCVLALSRSASRAVQVSGNTEVQLQGCDVASNSSAQDAFNMQGGSRLTTGCVHSAGGASVTQNLTLTDEINGEGPCENGPREHVMAIADPYRGVTQPTPSGTCENFSSKGGPGNRRAEPGHYCGMNLTQDMELESGLYIVDGDDFRIGPNTTITGTDVTIFLTNGAAVRINNNAEAQLSAPTTGPYAGILFFGDRNSVGVQHRFNGGANAEFTGALYLSADEIQFNGGAGLGNGCTQIIGDTVEFTGNSSVGADCTGTGVRNPQFGQQIALVE